MEDFEKSISSKIRALDFKICCLRNDVIAGGVTAFLDGSGFNGTVAGTNLSLKTTLAENSVPFIGATGQLL